MALAIDRFALSPELEQQAQDIAAQMGAHPSAPLLLGYLQSSVAEALERPRWRSRDRLAVDLRVVGILWERRDSRADFP